MNLCPEQLLQTASPQTLQVYLRFMSVNCVWQIAQLVVSSGFDVVLKRRGAFSRVLCKERTKQVG